MSVAVSWARAIGGIRFDAGQARFGDEALAELLDNVPVALAVTLGREHRYVYANRAFRKAVEPRSGDLIGRTVAEVMGDLFKQSQAIRERILATGESFEMSSAPVPLTPGGEATYWDIKMMPVRGDAEEVIGILTIGADVTAEVQARAEAENQARDAEYHTQRLGLALEATELGLWEWDARSGHTFWSERQKDIFGLPQGGTPSYDVWRDSIHPDDRDRIVSAVMSLMDPASGGQLRLEHRVLHGNGEVRWVECRGRMLYEVVDGRMIASRLLGTTLDITERKQAEEERQLLVRELNHRVKNLFAVAGGMVSLTARSAATPQDMGRTLRGRLEALARAHDLIRPVIAGDGVEKRVATISELVRAVLAPHEGDRLTMEGPDVPIGAHAATALTLVLHELATNAAKYGALSVAEGRLAIAWRTDGATVVLQWREEDGPPVGGPPTAEGFGSQLARKSITDQLGGTVSHDWRREGLGVTITLPADRLQR